MKKSEIKNLIKEVVSEELDDIRKGLALLVSAQNEVTEKPVNESLIKNQKNSKQRNKLVAKNFAKDNMLNTILNQTYSDIADGRIDPILEKSNGKRVLDINSLPEEKREFAKNLMTRDYSKVLKESIKHKK